MSLIGTLEQFSLANVLQRTEGHEKTGLLTIRQGAQWIEFYIRDGRLLCVGPLRTSATLGERLLQDGIISPTAFQEISRAFGEANKSEAQTARTLMELRHVSRDDLRNWTIKNTAEVLKVLLLWTSGEIYFDEDAPSPTERLLVAMSISTLLADATAALSSSAPAAKPSVYSSIGTTPVMPVQPVPLTAPSAQQANRPVAPAATPRTPSPDVARVPTLMSASQFLDDSSFAASSFATSFPSTGAIEPVAKEEKEEKPETPSFTDIAPLFADSASTQDSSGGFLSLFGDDDDASSPGAVPALQPVPVMNPVPPRRIDTSFMLPDMILLPTDLSAYRDQNPQVQITPDQWCILARVDGRTPLTTICQELGSTPDIVCPIIGELIAEGLITASLPNEQPSHEASPVARELVASGLGNGYVAPGYASTAASPWSASMPAIPPSDSISPMPGGPAVGNSVETESQWGNGGNGATFVPGRGWVTTPQPMQPLQSSGPLNSAPGGMYTPAGNGF